MNRFLRRRCFNHLVRELSAAVGQGVRRYALWLRFQELGWNPETLGRAAALAFCDVHLGSFLAEQGHQISPRGARRLRRAVKRFQPSPLG